MRASPACQVVACMMLLAPAGLNAQENIAFPPNRGTEDVTQRLQALELQMQQLRSGEFVFAQETSFERTPAVQESAYDSNHFCPGCYQPHQACICPKDPASGKPASGFPTVKVTGFFHLDAGFFNQDAVNRATLGDIEDGAGFRRARLAATGNVTERSSYMMELSSLWDSSPTSGHSHSVSSPSSPYRHS